MNPVASFAQAQPKTINSERIHLGYFEATVETFAFNADI
jgi:hypothetical protein